MKDRMKDLRKTLKMTQDEFSSKLGLSRNFIAQIEGGTKIPSDRTILDICREFSINEEWLRTGQGEMKRELTRNQQVLEFTNDALEEIDESFKKRLLVALSKLTEKDWENLADMAERVLKD